MKENYRGGRGRGDIGSDPMIDRQGYVEDLDVNLTIYCVPW